MVWRRGCDRVTCPAPRTGTSCCCTEIERPQAEGKRATFRADAVFAKPQIYEAVEECGVDYAIRIPAYKNLELGIEDIQFRPPGRPSRKPFVRYKGFCCQAESWSQPRRIIAKVEHHLGELFPRLGFIVTNMSLPSRSVVRFYNKRGTAEQWVKEGKQATSWTRLSCLRFRANEVWLQRCQYREAKAHSRNSQRTRVAEGRRGSGVAKKPFAVAGVR